MDPSAQYQNYQTQSQPYDPSSASSYYPYPHQYSNYPYYPPQDYSNYPHAVETSSSIHPPGVPVASQAQQYDQYYAYQQQKQQYDAATWQGVGVGSEAAPGGGAHALVGSSYSGGGSRGGRGGSSSFRGRGRGRGRGGLTQAAPKQPAPPRQMAWCELCRVDCNSLDILEKHREGKKHKKNLKMQEELERLNKIMVDRQNAKTEEQETTAETKVESKQESVLPGGPSGSKGRGSKRKMRGGRGSNKWIRTSEDSKAPVEPPKPKPKPKPVPFVCELCHITCETQVVFDTHLKGKKHMANLQHFQEQQTLLGHLALEALYPALQAILPALQGNYHPNPGASTSSTIASESKDPQAVLTQLLTSMLAPNNSAGSTSAAPLLQGGQDPQVVLAQVLASMIAPGQATAITGALSTSATGPPLVAESVNPETLPIHSEPVSEEAALAVASEEKSGNLETKSEMDNSNEEQVVQP